MYNLLPKLSARGVTFNGSLLVYLKEYTGGRGTGSLLMTMTFLLGWGECWGVDVTAAWSNAYTKSHWLEHCKRSVLRHVNYVWVKNKVIEIDKRECMFFVKTTTSESKNFGILTQERTKTSCNPGLLEEHRVGVWSEGFSSDLPGRTAHRILLLGGHSCTILPKPWRFLT